MSSSTTKDYSGRGCPSMREINVCAQDGYGFPSYGQAVRRHVESGCAGCAGLYKALARKPAAEPGQKEAPGSGAGMTAPSAQA